MHAAVIACPLGYLLAVERDWIDYASFAVTAATLLVGGFGLFYVYKSIMQAREEQWIQVGPYLRVDVAPTSEMISDLRLPDPYYEDISQVVEFVNGRGDADSKGVSCWFRNYQSHALGFALGVKAAFLVQVRPTEDDDYWPLQVEVEIPYLEHEKPIKVRLISFPLTWSVEVNLISLVFHDVFDEVHRHTFGVQGTNALHGRLFCAYRGGSFESVPEGRSRGEGVDFNLGAA